MDMASQIYQGRLLNSSLDFNNPYESSSPFCVIRKEKDVIKVNSAFSALPLFQSTQSIIFIQVTNFTVT